MWQRLRRLDVSLQSCSISSLILDPNFGWFGPCRTITEKLFIRNRGRQNKESGAATKHTFLLLGTCLATTIASPCQRKFLSTVRSSRTLQALKQSQMLNPRKKQCELLCCPIVRKHRCLLQLTIRRHPRCCCFVRVITNRLLCFYTLYVSAVLEIGNHYPISKLQCVQIGNHFPISGVLLTWKSVNHTWSWDISS